MKEANRICKRLRDNDIKYCLIYRPGLNVTKAVRLSAHDAAFDNLPGHRSQRGFFILLANPEILTEHGAEHVCQLVAWSSGRIGRAVPSTLSAEAYSCSEAMDALFWTRAALTEISDPDFEAKKYEEAEEHDKQQL